MKIDYTKKFIKQYHKLPTKTQARFKNRLDMFQKEPGNPILNKHPLRGNYQGFYSINVTGDVRALYTHRGNSIILFGFIGTHSQLYG